MVLHAMEERHDLLVVSNRGPIGFFRNEAGELVPKRGAGGLVVTLGPGAERDGAVWLASATSDDERQAAARGTVSTGGFRFSPVVVEPPDYAAYYDVIANQTLWFCLHGLWDRPRRPRFDRHWWAAWDRYRSVNKAFADAVCGCSAEGATVLVHDYHLALVPGMLAQRRPDLRTSVFLHTPWCSPAELATLPDTVSAELLDGLSSGGACGFHTLRWADEFQRCCGAVLGRTPATFVAPAATDIDDVRSVAESPACCEELQKLNSLVGDRKVIVRVDRIEPSKNVLRGFWAYDELLEQRPDLRGKVVFAAMVYPSRTGLAEYQAYSQEVLSLAESINARWASDGWQPILIDPTDNYPRSVAALRRADVLLVNPVRDGLNLVAKEGALVGERDPVLVLSHQAGAWEELGHSCVGVNPFDVTATAAALARALEMPDPERKQLAASLRSTAEKRTPLDWFDDLLDASRTPEAASAGQPG